MVRPAERHDVLIAGGGPVGLTLALALARREFDVALADPGGRKADNRAYFIAHGCWRMFEALGLASQLDGHAQQVASVEAKGAGGGIAFLADDQPERAALGHVIEAPHLEAVLAAAVKAAGVKIIPARAEGAAFGDPDATVTLNGQLTGASLLVACDGARSTIRQTAGLRFEGWDYPTKAISATLRVGSPHEGVARQVFLRGGPIALLPLTARDGVNRVSLVWTVPSAVADALMKLSEADFLAELDKQSDRFVSGVTLEGPRIVFPMGLRVAERFHGARVALAGDSAHLVHPLAGQGLNLGLKDAAALVDVIADAARVGLDIGSEAALAPYTRWRRADVVATAGAMEGFAQSFAGPAPVRAAAGLAMKLAGASRELRNVFAREAGGDLGELPSLMRKPIPEAAQAS